MILFFSSPTNVIFAVGTNQSLQVADIEKLVWLFSGARPLTESTLTGHFVGPRKEMITPWSTNAVEITQTMGISGIERIEEFFKVESSSATHDRMLQHLYPGLRSGPFHHSPHPRAHS